MAVTAGSSFSPAMKRNGKERLVSGAAPKEAISNNQLKLVYQPQIFAETGELYGIEALARWYDPPHGHAPPSRFIPLAEEIGEMKILGAGSSRKLAVKLQNGVARIFISRRYPLTVCAALSQ